MTADSLIALAYLAISVTLAYLVYKARSDIPFHWMFLAFGLFIIACGGTHFMEVVTIWKPVYVFSAAVKLFTALVSLMTAAVLPFNVPTILTLVQRAKASEQVTATLRASEERKEALLREVHHRVKNNLAVVCSLFYLQSTHTKDEPTIQVFREMENRVHSMALVHETLYGSSERADFERLQARVSQWREGRNQSDPTRSTRRQVSALRRGQWSGNPRRSGCQHQEVTWAAPGTLVDRSDSWLVRVGQDQSRDLGPLAVQGDQSCTLTSFLLGRAL